MLNFIKRPNCYMQITQNRQRLLIPRFMQLDTRKILECTSTDAIDCYGKL